MAFSPRETELMQRALELAARGQGHVEPNPMVGAVIVAGDEIIGEGFHTAFGQPHAEIEALQAAGTQARGATMFVTLEPCCHHGKTPPCTAAIIQAGVARVVVATGDPFAEVAGGGLAELTAAGIDVTAGLLENEARELNAPYFKLVRTGLPWIIAKWAMTLDGKLATATGDSRWVSSEASRAIVHQIRGRVDAVMVGRGTAAADDPLLTARPAGPRVATRIVVDAAAALSPESQLVRSLDAAPVLLAAATDAPAVAVERLKAAGVEVLQFAGDHRARLSALLAELGRRRMTNVLVEGGAKLLGGFFDARLVDEVHVFIAPKIAGGGGLPPVGGAGVELMSDAAMLESVSIRAVEGDVYFRGRLGKKT